ncbi:MAG: hypothetical protein KJ579_01695 [Verrucomicrobia bacterium]|nr:hypothetical protein [Verrucomicrobiota bacterium]
MTKPLGSSVRWVRLAVALVAIALALAYFIYPAVTLAIVLWDPQLKNTGQSRLVPAWFVAAAHRYDAWAAEYQRSRYAAAIHPDHVAGTEWPMFGSVFFLVTARDLQREGRIDASRGIVSSAAKKAAAIVVSPVTATWVKAKWGDSYLDNENVFYRMLLILGLSAYEELSGDRQYRALMSSQRRELAEELSSAPLHLRDDYPGECYPSDVLWAVAAIQRAARLEGTNHDALVRSLMADFDGPVKAAEGLPAFRVASRSGRLLQGARGCGNSGILMFASELDPGIAARWYEAHAAGFWTRNAWVAGFREFPHGSRTAFADVDSGPVLWDIGSVASAFGIGAARLSGRLDHAVPLTYEAVAASWPTPFGLLLPGAMGKHAAGSWSLGEIALLFSMTRPLPPGQPVRFTGRVPGSVWIMLFVYTGLGSLLLCAGIRRMGGFRSARRPPR